jgi:hypothetical protein
MKQRTAADPVRQRQSRVSIIRELMLTYLPLLIAVSAWFGFIAVAGMVYVQTRQRAFLQVIFALIGLPFLFSLVWIALVGAWPLGSNVLSVYSMVASVTATALLIHAILRLERAIR